MARLRKLFRLLTLAGLTWLVVLNLHLPATAQLLPQLEQLDQVVESIARDRSSRPVLLDGRPLFVVVGQGDDPLSLNQRVAEIEQRLHTIASTITDPDTVEIAATIEPDSRETVITINGEYVMTVTNLDAKNQGMTVPQWASALRLILREGLKVYAQERQWSARLYQSLWASLLLLGSIGISGLVEWRWQKLKTQKQTCEQQIQAIQRLESEVESLAQEQAAEKISLQDQLRQVEDQQTLLRFGQICLWVAVVVICLGIFPYTRGWQYILITNLGSTAVYLLVLVVGTFLLHRFSEYSISRLFNSLRQGRWFSNPRLLKRIKTFSGVLKGITNVCIALVSGLIALSIVGISVVPFVTSLGFIGLGISLAAQDILKDVLNGMLILLEDQFAEGDMISVNGHVGQVEQMNLRITQLRNAEGSLITIPNSAIKLVENLSNGWARVNLGIDVAYDTDIDRAIQVIQRVAEQMSEERAWRQQIIDRPQVLGVDNLGEHSITIRVWIKVQPLKQWEVAREYRLRLKKAFDREGITIPFPQTEVWFRTGLQVEQHPSLDGTVNTASTGSEGIYRTTQ
jgi:small-conductance mechanosensitive channel